MASYRVPPTEIWSAGLATHHLVHPLPDSSALTQLIGAVGRRQYGTESSRLTRSLSRYLTQGDESSRLVLLTQGHGHKWLRMENGSWLSMVVEVIQLTYDARSQDVLPVRGTGERMVRYTGMLAFRFFVHRGSERKRSDSVVATSEYMSVEVIIPEDETEEKAGDALQYHFTDAYREGAVDFSSEGHVPVSEAAEAEMSRAGYTASTSDSKAAEPFPVSSGDGVVRRWPTGIAWSTDQDKDAADYARNVPESVPDAGAAAVPLAFASASVSGSNPGPRTGSDAESRRETSTRPRAEPAFVSVCSGDRASRPEGPEVGPEGLDLPVPVGEGFRLWGPTGDVAVQRLSKALTEAGSGSSAFVVVFRPGSTDVDQYRVRNEDGRLVWLAGSSDNEVQPPTDAIHGASFVSGPDGSPWFPPAETSAQPHAETPEPAESSWHRSQNFPRQLLRGYPGALWHYVVDDSGEILLSRTAAEPSGVEPGFARVAGELTWDEESRCWKINDREGWFLDEQARQELDNDPNSPYRWLWNIAHRLQNHLDIRIEPAQMPPVALTEEQHESIPVEVGEAVAAADVALPLWDSAPDVEIRRLIEALQKAGPGAKALVVVIRQGRDQVERYRVHNQAGRLVWMVDLTDEETEPPWDAATGASFIWRPDGSLLAR